MLSQVLLHTDLLYLFAWKPIKDVIKKGSLATLSVVNSQLSASEQVYTPGDSHGHVLNENLTR